MFEKGSLNYEINSHRKSTRGNRSVFTGNHNGRIALHVGSDPATGKIAESVEAQAEQVFKNISEIVKEAGADMSKVVKTTVFIKNMDDFAKINEVYAKFFTEPYPARSCVEVARPTRRLCCPRVIF